MKTTIPRFLILIEFGRLGNQCFQLHALRHLYPDSKIVAFGYRSFNQLFYLNNFISIPVKPVFMKLFKEFILFCCRIRLLTFSAQINETDIQVKKKIGLLQFCEYFKEAHFQNEAFISQLEYQPSFYLRNLLRESALMWIKSITSDSNKNLGFLHIRRGDYVTWPSRKNPAVLKKQWIVEQVDYLYQKVESLELIIISDDIPYAMDILEDKYKVHYSYNDFAIDFAIATYCKYGILSPSSFSWWAANISRHVNSFDSNYMFIAPQEWLGSNHPNPRVNWLTYR